MKPDFGKNHNSIKVPIWHETEDRQYLPAVIFLFSVLDEEDLN